MVSVRRMFVVGIFLLSTIDLHAASMPLKVAWPFADNMVLQRNIETHVRGTAAAGSVIAISFAGKKVKTKADMAGAWKAALPVLTAGGPYNMTVKTGANQILFKNILVGDVWFISGQSNMSVPVKDFKDASSWLKEAEFPKIRFCTLQQVRGVSVPPWKTCNADVAREFSATGFLFGRYLYKEKKVAIGLLNASANGSVINKWISEEALLTIPYEAKRLAEYKTSLPEKKKKLTEYNTEMARRRALSKEEAVALPKLQHPGVPYRLESTLYNERIKLCLPFAVKGFLWYQGESDGMFSKGGRYKTYLKTLITSWRTEFGCENAPFLVIQLPNFGGCIGWPALRDAQWFVAMNTPATGLVVTIDIGETKNIHPNDKLEVARRAALCARHLAYQEELIYQGPTYKGMKIEGSKIKIAFDHVGGGLIAKEALKHFSIAGENKRFFPAQTKIEGKYVFAWSDKVATPVAVRYGWAQDPQEGFLRNKEGLPASPFRTDTWRLATDW